MHDDFDPADLDPETVAAVDGAAAQAFADRKAQLTRALLDGETGVQYESLALFAEPLFSLYDLDAADAFRLRTAPGAVGDDTVALLETARVLWAFFSLPPSERAHKRQSLAAQLVGEDPSEEDWMGLDGLLGDGRDPLAGPPARGGRGGAVDGPPGVGLRRAPAPPGVPGRPRGRGTRRTQASGRRA